MFKSFLKAFAVGLTASVVGVVVAVVSIFAIFLFAIFGALMGAITGFILQHTPVLGQIVIDGFSSFGIVEPNLTAIGGALGFIAGFFKSSFAGEGKRD
jgi:hypothetical protein